MDLDPGGEQEGEWGVGGNEGNGDVDDAKEKNNAPSFVSFSSEKEKETKEPCGRKPYANAIVIFQRPKS